MAEMSANVHNITALSGAENYPIWKIRMTNILTDQGLFDYADGSITIANYSGNVNEWRTHDRRALATIRYHIEDEPFAHIAGSGTSNDAWNTLSSIYEARGISAIVTFRRKLFRTRCAEGADIEEHIGILCGYTNELARLGSKINDEDFSIALLESLPDSWDSFISSIDLVALKESYKLIAKILVENRRRIGTL